MKMASTLRTTNSEGSETKMTEIDDSAIDETPIFIDSDDAGISQLDLDIFNSNID